VPSLLSWQLISALLGPSTAKDKPPATRKNKYLLPTYSDMLLWLFRFSHYFIFFRLHSLSFYVWLYVLYASV
jgi:hypothetical protein